MQISELGLQFLLEEEGFKNKVYPDSGGAPTIGIGHLLTKAERMSGKVIINIPSVTTPLVVKYGYGLTDEQVLLLLRSDLLPVEKLVSKLVTVKLEQWQFDTLVSFTYNIGDAGFENSTLLKILNKSMYSAVPDQLKRWVHDNGKVVKGLVNRRNHEILLWNNTWRPAHV